MDTEQKVRKLVIMNELEKQGVLKISGLFLYFRIAVNAICIMYHASVNSESLEFCQSPNLEGV